MSAGKLLDKGRAWLAVGKSAVLVTLPAPLFLTAVIDLASGRVAEFALSGGGIASFWTAAVLAFSALVGEARFHGGLRADPPRVPLKLTSLAFTALGTALAAASGDHTPLGIALFAALAAGGHRLFFGRDPQARRIALATVDGIDAPAVLAQVKQAYGRLQGIESAAAAIAVPEFGERLRRITAIGYRVLAEIERDPRDASRARKFLNVYLDSAQRVTAEYARTHRQLRNRPLEADFRQLLVDMEATFEAQHRMLLEQDALALEVEIEVLNARLKREGLN